jgi:hypothetical protein
VDSFLKSSVRLQFGAAIDMLDNAIVACPDDLWGEHSGPQAFWYVTYHTLFWLDLYLIGSVEGFAPPPPFNLDELDPAGLLPDRVYSKEELRTYLTHCRQKCQTTIESLTDEKARQTRVFGWGEISFLELLLYNMRHVQEHASQLALMIGQKYDSAPGWVTRARSQ